MWRSFARTTHPEEKVELARARQTSAHKAGYRGLIDEEEGEGKTSDEEMEEEKDEDLGNKEEETAEESRKQIDKFITRLQQKNKTENSYEEKSKKRKLAAIISEEGGDSPLLKRIKNEPVDEEKEEETLESLREAADIEKIIEKDRRIEKMRKKNKLYNERVEEGFRAKRIKVEPEVDEGDIIEEFGLVVKQKPPRQIKEEPMMVIRGKTGLC